MSKGFSKISKPHALLLLSLCDGDEIWSLEYCRARKIPEDWLAKLRDVFESDFSDPSSTIFEDGKRIAQFEGVRTVDIAVYAAESLGIKVDPWVLANNHRAMIVSWIKEQIEL